MPGLDAVIAGVTRAAYALSWTVVGIRNGYEGLLFPERYPSGGLLPLTPDLVDGAAPGALLGASQLDPLRVQALTADGQADEVDREQESCRKLCKVGVCRRLALVTSETTSTGAIRPMHIGWYFAKSSRVSDPIDSFTARNRPCR